MVPACVRVAATATSDPSHKRLNGSVYNTQTGTGLVAFAVAGLALASRYLPITNHVVLLTAALSPYLMLCGPVSVVC